jgi:hypothetical protein
MTDTGTPSDLVSLEPLEPLDAASPASGPGGPGEDPLQAQRSGLPCPAYSMYCRDKAFYRFLFAGVLMLVGTLLPYGPEPGRALCQTMSGALIVVLSIAMIWTWWGALANNRSTNASLKWLLFCMLPLVAGIWNMIAFDAVAALEMAKNYQWLPQNAEASENWKALLSDMFGGLVKRNPEWLTRAEVFWRLYGPGNMLVVLGALIAEIGFLGGVVGGAKQNKADVKAKQMAAAERRRR